MMCDVSGISSNPIKRFAKDQPHPTLNAVKDVNAIGEA
jgi:hypothetical protein